MTLNEPSSFSHRLTFLSFLPGRSSSREKCDDFRALRLGDRARFPAGQLESTDPLGYVTRQRTHATSLLSLSFTPSLFLPLSPPPRRTPESRSRSLHNSSSPLGSSLFFCDLLLPTSQPPHRQPLDLATSRFTSAPLPSPDLHFSFPVALSQPRVKTYGEISWSPGARAKWRKADELPNRKRLRNYAQRLNAVSQAGLPGSIDRPNETRRGKYASLASTGSTLDSRLRSSRFSSRSRGIRDFRGRWSR